MTPVAPVAPVAPGSIIRIHVGDILKASMASLGLFRHKLHRPGRKIETIPLWRSFHAEFPWENPIDYEPTIEKGIIIDNYGNIMVILW